MSEDSPEYGEVGRVTTNLRVNRDASNVEAREAMRNLEGRLVAALGGERLLNTPNLATSNEPIYGYRIRSKEPDKTLSWRGKQTLILSARGALEVAWRTRDGCGWRDAIDDELRAEDLARFLEVAQLAIERHLQKAERRTRRFQNVRELADKVNFILGD
jgi:hypothetical protein